MTKNWRCGPLDRALRIAASQDRTIDEEKKKYHPPVEGGPLGCIQVQKPGIDSGDNQLHLHVLDALQRLWAQEISSAESILV